MKKKATTPKKRTPHSNPSPYPRGWDRQRVQALIDHYKNQSDDDAIAEAEAAYKDPSTAMIQMPLKLVPEVRKVLSKRAG